MLCLYERNLSPWLSKKGVISVSCVDVINQLSDDLQVGEGWLECFLLAEPPTSAV